MTFKGFFRLGALSLGALSVAGCLDGSSSGGGGTTGPITAADFDAEYTRISGMVPTSDMPTRLDASFTGAAQVDLVDTASGNTRGEAFADLALDLDWTDGQTTNPWSGTAENIRGTFDGTDFAANGTMTVADAEAAGFTSTVARTTQTIPLPTGGTVDVAAGAASVNLVGNIELDGNADDVLLALGGTFVGTEGQALHGAAQAVWFDTKAGFGDVQGAGTFYVER
ncbi:hypothetical protein [Pseudooceanicola nanhaiensis]|uniref:hypothetical protein n=1 Tax=Pseudooceanicola nanhaiensis TaxID=375761 RepID=UPI001CD3FA84|nr:hypothetical protein [Pseudooceanicola nanhaiensis]MCA0922057.1 hypothetical protein [Pseudooceanicola nanhaiensis]